MGKLRQLNEQTKLALWAERVSECRNSGQSVLSWCKEHGICSQTYYKWQKRLYALAQAQQESQFAEVTPVMGPREAASVAITIHVAGVSAEIHNGADPDTVESVLRILKLC